MFLRLYIGGVAYCTRLPLDGAALDAVINKDTNFLFFIADSHGYLAWYALDEWSILEVLPPPVETVRRAQHDDIRNFFAGNAFAFEIVPEA
jgi:hypothetical protein